MTLRLGVAIACVLAVSAPAVAQNDLKVLFRNNDPSPPRSAARVPIAKNATVPRMPAEPTGWLTLKFLDDVQARWVDDGFVSETGTDLTEVTQIIDGFGAEVRPLFRVDDAILTSLEERAALRTGQPPMDLRGFFAVKPDPNDLLALARALYRNGSTEFVSIAEELRPGGGDPPEACCFPPVDYNCEMLDPDDCLDICGIPQGPGSICDDPLTPKVEFACPVTGQCCFNDGDICLDLTEASCNNTGGSYSGDGTACCQDQACDPGCGDPTANDCLVVDPAGEPFCNDTDCCDLVCSIDPFCCDDENGGFWDLQCAGWANTLCALPGADPCLNPFTGGCFDPHPTPGCLPGDCCETVCEIDPFCCEITWDDGCAAIAIDLCLGGTPPDADATPDFRPQQGYLRAESYLAQPGGLPPDLCGLAAVAFPGYTGEGWDLGDPSPDEDADPDDWEAGPNGILGDFDDRLPWSNDLPVHPSWGDGIPDNDFDTEDFDGLYGMSRLLFYEYGIGQGAGDPDTFGDGGHADPETWSELAANAAGRGIKVAVIEWGYYEDHEDLSVTTEPGVTLIVEPIITFPDHATACLGILNAKDNDKGVVGIAPQADAYFFPLTTVEDGPRFAEAFIQCYNELDPGDVVSCSFGGFGNLNTDPFFYSLMQFGTSLGITTVVAAGNSCTNLADLPDLGDPLAPMGAIVAGACTPGAPWCRLIFSSHYQGDYDFVASNRVDCSGWGTCVTTTGYGVLYGPSGDPNRFYTNSFGGTSAAAPQIASLAACLQGLAKQFYGVPLPPDRILALVNDGLLQCQVFPDDLPGFDNAVVPCALDRDPDEEGNHIGPYPLPLSSGVNLVNQDFAGFGDSPFLDDILIIRGLHEFGNIFSVKASDNQYLVVESLPTDRFFEPNLPDPEGLVAYMMSAQIVDFRVIAHADRPNSTNMTVTIEYQRPDVIGIMILEAYNWDAKDWDFIGFDVVGDEPDPGDWLYTTFVGAPAPYLGGHGVEARVRFTVYGLGGGTAGGLGQPGIQLPFDFRPDWISVDFGSGFGPDVGGDGAGGADVGG